MAGAAEARGVARTAHLRVTHLLLKEEPTSTGLHKMFRAPWWSCRPCLYTA